MKIVRIRIPLGNPKSKSKKKKRYFTASIQGTTRKEAVANAKRFYREHMKNMGPLTIAGAKQQKSR